MSGVIEHALLSASSAHRWLNCTPSARLERELEESSGASAEDNSGEYAAEGTAAHALAEHKLRRALQLRSKQPVSPYDCAEMFLNLIKAKEAAAYIPVSASSYKIDEALFSYNKDSDQWFCNMGNETVQVKTKTSKQNGKQKKLLIYSFERERCRNCCRRAECVGKSTQIARLLRVSVNTPELYEYSQRAKTPEFLNEYRKRAKIEPKHAELKRFHGLDRAKGYGLQSVRIQAKLTALAVNLKRIAKLVSA